MPDHNTWVIHLGGFIYWKLRENGPTEVVVPFLLHAPADRDRSDRTIMITEIGDVIT